MFNQRHYSRLEVVWFTLLAVITGFNLFATTICIAFDIAPSQTQRTLEGIFDTVLIIDIALKIRSLRRHSRLFIPGEHGLLSQPKVMLTMDILASLPLTLLLGPLFPNISASSTQLFRLPRLIRVLYCFKYMASWRQFFNVHSAYHRILKFALIAALGIHILGSTFFYIALQEGIQMNTWVMHNGLLSASPFSQYLHSVYWALTTMTTVGYGDITPQTNPEIAFTMLTQVAGVIMYSFVIANIVSTITNLDARGAVLREKMNSIESYMRQRKLPVDLQQRIRTYYHFVWNRHREVGEKEILTDLPDTLKVDVFVHINSEIIEKVPLFQGASPEFIQAIALKLKPRVYAPNEKIIKQDSVGDEMFFIAFGEVEVIAEETQGVCNVLRNGNFFGEIALLYSETRIATVKSRTWCDLFVLTREDFEGLMNQFPAFTQAVHENARKMYTHKSTSKNEYEPQNWNPIQVDSKKPPKSSIDT